MTSLITMNTATGPAPKPTSGPATVTSICLSLQLVLAAWRVAWLQVASCLIGEGPQDQDWGGSAEEQCLAPGCVDVAPRRSPKYAPPELTLGLCQTQVPDDRIPVPATSAGHDKALPPEHGGAPSAA